MKKNNCRKDEIYKNQELKTELQWAKLKKLPNENAKGIWLYCNYVHHTSAIYYLPEEVHDATKEELDIFFKPYRDRRKIQYQERKNRLKDEEKEKRRYFEEQIELSYQRGIAFYRQQMGERKEIIYNAITKNIPESLSNNNHREGIVFDVETTGLSSKYDEILQISIIDLNGNILLNSYVKPYFNIEWTEAMKVNGIKPEMVENAPYPHELIPLVRDIFSSSDTWIGYNINFDLAFLRYWGIDSTDNTIKIDVMRDFSALYGVWSSYYEDFKYQSLDRCARYFEYDEFEAHNSLEDVKATLHCYKCIEEMIKNGSYQEIVHSNYERIYKDNE